MKFLESTEMKYYRVFFPGVYPVECNLGEGNSKLTVLSLSRSNEDLQTVVWTEKPRSKTLMSAFL